MSVSVAGQQFKIKPLHITVSHYLQHFARVKFLAIPSNILHVILPTHSWSSHRLFPFNFCK